MLAFGKLGHNCGLKNFFHFFSSLFLVIVLRTKMDGFSKSGDIYLCMYVCMYVCIEYLYSHR